MMTGLRAWKFDSRQALSGGCLALLAMLTSCATRGNVEMLEAQLRTQETAIRRYEDSISQLQEDLRVSQRETDLLRRNLAEQNSFVSYEEVTASVSRAKELVFNTFLTAAVDHDQATGDERLHAVFYPSDARGEVVKLTGDLIVEAIDPSRPDGDRQIGYWKYTPEQSRQLWHSGFLSSGFQVSETWQRMPRGNKVVLIARLNTVDGRKFEATHTIPVDPESDVATIKAVGNVRPVSRQSAADSSGETRRVPDPEPWEHDVKPSSRSGTTRETSSSDIGISSPQAMPSSPAPFPSRVDTSDRWTEAEIPVLR